MRTLTAPSTSGVSTENRSPPIVGPTAGGPDVSGQKIGIQAPMPIVATNIMAAAMPLMRPVRETFASPGPCCVASRGTGRFPPAPGDVRSGNVGDTGCCAGCARWLVAMRMATAATTTAKAAILLLLTRLGRNLQSRCYAASHTPIADRPNVGSRQSVQIYGACSCWQGEPYGRPQVPSSSLRVRKFFCTKQEDTPFPDLW